MRAILLVTALALFLSSPAFSQADSTLTRDREPVILRGSSLTRLLGVPVGEIVAFKYVGGWIQIPVQVDERKIIDYGPIFNLPAVGLLTTAYADADTYTGTDPAPAFDADDEVVFMVKDAGGRAPVTAGVPAGVVPALSVQVILADSLNAKLGFVYLFRSFGGLDPAAGANYIDYSFNLLAGPYVPNYSTASGPNPEDSTVSSSAYQLHFSDRWVRDEIRISAGAATGADILDRHRSQLGPGDCSRTEQTFTEGIGAFAANIDGPVRCVRSYYGANSGPLTQRDHFFYEEREEVVTRVRVPSLPGLMDLFDYSPDAAGMSYENDLMGLPVTVDGLQDAVAQGAILWELVSGLPGSLLIAHGFQSSIPGFAYTSFYSDDLNGQFAQCSGDAAEYGTSGIWIDQPLPNTDPLRPGAKQLTTRRILAYAAPGANAADAQLHYDQNVTPLQVVLIDFVPVDTIVLTGDTAGTVGAPVSYDIAGPHPNSPYAIYYSRRLNGSEIQGQPFDIGPGLRLAASGTTGPTGAASWTSAPLPNAARGRTFYVEARVDATGLTFDSNALALVVAP